jgi:hypothetical protein
MATSMRANPERVAWQVLTVAFVVFLLICLGAVYVAQWYIFQSATDMKVNLVVSRGTVQLRPANSDEPIAITDRRDDLRGEATILTDSTTQAALTFLDPRTSDVIASLVVFPDTEIRLVEMAAPRYGLNSNPYVIRASDLSGQLEVLVFDPSPQSTQFELLSQHASTYISEQGHYTIATNGQNSEITVWDGSAVVDSNGNRDRIELGRNQHTVIQNTGESITITDAEIPLVVNHDFSHALDEGWRLYNVGIPIGNASTTVFDGRPVVIFDRSQGHWPDQALGHGETGLIQELQVDVTDYANLEIQATLFIDEQSLSTCGEAGSECPLMMNINYIDPAGNEQEFIHGFYATTEPQLSYPQACASCRSEHERINLKSWYTYESGNLLELWPAEQRPEYINSISVYASGHAYKVFLSDISILASK